MELIIQQFGASLQVRDGLFTIKHKEGISSVPVGKVHSITLYKGVKVSTDALYVALDMGIDVLLADRRGDPIGRLWNNRFGSISTIRKNQLAFSRSPQAVPWVRQILLQKAEPQRAVLLGLEAGDKPYPTPPLTPVLEKIDRILAQMQAIDGSDLPELAPRFRALEGQVSRIYFETVNWYLPDQYRFDRRSKHPALDMTNAFCTAAWTLR